MKDINVEIESKVAQLFKKQETLNIQGKEVSIVEVLGVQMQTTPENYETEEFSISFRGKMTDENGGIFESCYTCQAKAKVNVSINVEPINVISCN